MRRPICVRAVAIASNLAPERQNIKNETGSTPPRASPNPILHFSNARRSAATGTARLSNMFGEYLCMRSISFALVLAIDGRNPGEAGYYACPDGRRHMFTTAVNEIKRIHKVSPNMVESRGGAMEPPPSAPGKRKMRRREPLSRVENAPRERREEPP